VRVVTGAMMAPEDERWRVWTATNGAVVRSARNRTRERSGLMTLR
jgi:hypothetical protein